MRCTMKQFTGFMHGIDLGGWLSQCVHTMEHYETFITEADFRTVKEWGLDHVRIPVDYDLVETPDGTYKEEGFAILQRAVDWCGKYGLNMLLDLHKTFGFSFDPGEKENGFFENPASRERFFRLWEEFAERFGQYAGRLSFELLNEVTDSAYSDIWNQTAEQCIERIRRIAPAISILVGGYHHNSFHALKDLLPPADENIVYNFHFYEPLVFTHQGAYWIPEMGTSYRMPLRSSYGRYDADTRQHTAGWGADLSRYNPDKTFGSEFFEDCLAEAAAVAEERNAALYCGEFGVIDLASPEDTLDWYRMVCSCFDRYGIGRAAWSYREMDFGLADPRMDPVRAEILKVL